MKQGTHRVAVTGIGGIAFAEEQHAAFLAHGIKAVRPTIATSVFGPLSIQAAFGPDEMRILADGIRAGSEVRRILPFRQILTCLSEAPPSPGR